MTATEVIDIRLNTSLNDLFSVPETVKTINMPTYQMLSSLQVPYYFDHNLDEK